MPVSLGALTALVGIGAPPPLAAQTPDNQAETSFDEIVQARIQPQAEKLLVALVAEGRGLKIDGTPVFNGSDKFLPGKIALGLADFLSSLPKDDPRLPEYLADFAKIAKLTADDPNDSWGIYYYLSALDRLREAGQLKRAVDPLTLAKLRVRLDWRSFVDVDTYALIDHPNNYYCVAFGIARLRAKMGWDGPEPVHRLYGELVKHYLQYSGKYGFADETGGEGRFDRYSILLAGEITERFIQTGEKPTAEVLGWLRKSADVMLLRVNPEGEGFEYGRSIGPYGETSIIEVLTAAATVGLLTDSEKQLAYAYASRAAKRYVDFWIDPRTGSVNLWDGGRRTDDYRGKFRILGENLSLAHQYVFTNALWNALGFKGRTPGIDWSRALSAMPNRTVTWFARGKYDRLLLTLRDGQRLISLPLINGGASQHMHSPYFPIPFSPGMLVGVADGTAPLLVPKLTLADGSVLMPLAYMKDVKVDGGRSRTEVTYRQSELDRMGGEAPLADDRVTVETRYVFEPGKISRTDRFTAKPGVKVKGLDLEFGTFSDAASANAGTVSFGRGAVTRFDAHGAGDCSARPTNGDPAYRGSSGAMATVVRCSGSGAEAGATFSIGWTISYRRK